MKTTRPKRKRKPAPAPILPVCCGWACPSCGAAIGVMCVRFSGRPRETAHYARVLNMGPLPKVKRWMKLTKFEEMLP